MWEIFAFSPLDLLRERQVMHGLNVWGDFFDPRLVESANGVRSLLTRQFITNEFYAYHVVTYSIVGPVLWSVLFDPGTDRPDWTARRTVYLPGRPYPWTL